MNLLKKYNKYIYDQYTKNVIKPFIRVFSIDIRLVAVYNVKARMCNLSAYESSLHNNKAQRAVIKELSNGIESPNWR